jgi:hypothetical protein
MHTRKRKVLDGRCNDGLCFIKAFQLNTFNFYQCSLRFIDGEKGRGVVAEEDIPKNTVLCLFPGTETHRIPEDKPIPMTEWASHDRDTLLDAAQELLPISPYSITCCASEFDAHGEPTGMFRYRVLDPCNEDEATAAQLQHLNAAYKELDYYYQDEMVQIPEHVRVLTEFKARSVYERLRMNLRRLRRLPLSDVLPFELVLEMTRTMPAVVMYVAGKYHFVCDFDQVTQAEHCKSNILLALNSDWDIRRHRRQILMERARQLVISDDYEYMGAFINEPTKSKGESANVIFEDTLDWIPRVSRLKEETHRRHAGLIHETRSPFTEARLDYLQRIAVTTTRPIKCGEEILVSYSRTRF